MKDIEADLINIKKEFYRYRNGVIADTLRKSYPEYQLIFGLILPQIAEIASKYSKNLELANALWRRKECRENRILALYIMPVNALNKDEVEKLIKDLSTFEEAEILNFKILRFLPFANSLIKEFEVSDGNVGKFHHRAIYLLKKSIESQN